MRLKAALLLVVLGVLGGCRKPAAVPNPASFDRPGAVAFGCYNTLSTVDATTNEVLVGPHFLPYADCTPDADGNLPTGLHLVAFVAQQATGELAAVDLTTRRVMDGSLLVPGFTFPKVGELPSGVAVPPADTSIVFVSNLGSRTVQTVSSTDFNYLADPRFRQAGAGSTVVLPDGPTDLAYFPTTQGRGLLFAPLPYYGAIAVIEVDAQGFLTLRGTYLVPSNGGMTPPAPVTPPSGGAEYERLCPTVQDTSTPANTPIDARTATITPRTPVSLGTKPEPIRVRVVEGPSGPELLVADQALPYIHRFQLTADAANPTGLVGVDQPIPVSVPQNDLVVTPRVPAVLGASVPATEQYIYAIDATDESVFVVDYTGTKDSGGNVVLGPSFGAVLPVAVGDSAADRIPMPVPARVLTVLEPQYALDDAGVPENQCLPDGSSGTPSEATPTRMRGVFVAIGTSEGTIRFVDVYDLDAACRGGASCKDPAVSGDDRVVIRRHHSRIGTLMTRAPSTTSTPTMTFLSQSGIVGTDGFVAGSTSLGLAPLSTCPGDPSSEAQQLRIYPDLATTNVQPIVCALDDMHDVVGQPWSIVYEGAIPGAFGARGRLSLSGTTGGLVLTDAEPAFCSRGVLGTDDVTASNLNPALDPEAAYTGDMMVVVSEMPWISQQDPSCAKFLADSNGNLPFVAFRIVSAFEGQLVLGDQVVGDDYVATTPSELLSCYTDPISYRVHTYSAFTVATISGTYKEAFRHRVVTSTGGACRVDTTRYPVNPANPDSYRNGRALPGSTYIHPQIAFQIRPLPDANRHNVTGKVAFTVGIVPSLLRIDVGLLPEALAWSPYDGGLYMVDVGNNQMVQLAVTPLTRTATLR